MEPQTLLLTGFEPYGGRGVNPSGEVVKSLDGAQINGYEVVGQTMPVSFKNIQQRMEALIKDFNPAAVISLGLWPGEPMIRLERFAVNLTDFEIPDNDGLCLDKGNITGEGQVALSTTLPLREISEKLSAAGIPARISNTAGTFLCNATLFCALQTIKDQGLTTLCGFVHLPYLPRQVAELVAGLKKERQSELHQRADRASMSLDTMTRAVEICLQTTVACLKGVNL
jgi:pyroglutamyl-peptidase